MSLLRRFRILHLAGLYFFALQLADAPALIADARTSKYLICPHTKAQFLRGNPCPCGHKHGKKRRVLRLENQIQDCDTSEDPERTRTPGFEAFVFIFDRQLLAHSTERFLIALREAAIPTGLLSDPPDHPS